MIKFNKLWKNTKKVKRNINEVEYYNINLSEYIIIDVRNRREFRENHINGAINIPLSELKRNFERYVKDKNKKILVYCQSGTRSKKAIDIIIAMGYENIFNLKGGIENI